MTGTAVSRIDHPIAKDLRAASAQFAPFLPAGTDIEWVSAQVYLEFQRVPQLAKCTPASVVSAASRLVSWGFDIGRTGYLVPFKDKKSGASIATPVPGYKGFIELVLATGAAHDCDAREVREGDHFEYEFGTDGRLRHVPGAKNPRNRGRITHFYVVWKIRFGRAKFDVMSLDEVEDIRLKYSKQWGADKWARGECEAWYGIKTVIRRGAKQLPQNPKLTKFFAALHADEIEELGDAHVSTLTTDAPPDLGATAAAPARAPDPEPAEFEVVEEVPTPAPFTLPNWRGHPLSGKTLAECETAALQVLHKDLRGAADRGDNRFAEVLDRVSIELDERRNKAA